VSRVPASKILAVAAAACALAGIVVYLEAERDYTR
jgi:hypothetical protein